MIRNAHYPLTTSKSFAAAGSPARRSALAVIRCWIERSRQRRELAQLVDNELLLRDMGITRVDALREVAKPFWR